MLEDLLQSTTKKLSNLSKVHKQLIFILVTSFLIKIIYVFHFTDYKNYLFSDMGGYWGRAQERYDGGIFNLGQWTAWVPFYHFYLAEVFKLLAFLHLFDHKLEIVLILNIIYSTISVYCLYFVSKQILKNDNHSLLVTLLYAFTYPFIYLNAFVLTENFAIPLLILSVCLLFNCHEKKSALFINGLIFGIAVATRPSLLPVAISFFLYIIYATIPNRKSLLRGAVFALGFALIIFFTIVEISHISKGEVVGLCGNTGAVFFISQCKHHSIESHYNGYVFSIGPPLNWQHSDWSDYKTEHPLHDQSYFYKLGYECMKSNPHYLVESFKNLKTLFFNTLMPAVSSAASFDFFIKLSSYVIFFMTISLGFLYFLIRDKVVETKKVLFLLSIPFCTILMSFFYPPEQRYFYSCVFVIYILFFTMLTHLKKYSKEVKIYLISLVLIYFLFFNRI